MSADLQFLEEWIPERMDPGTVFVLTSCPPVGRCNRAKPQTPASSVFLQQQAANGMFGGEEPPFEISVDGKGASSQMDSRPGSIDSDSFLHLARFA